MWRDDYFQNLKINGFCELSLEHLNLIGCWADESLVVNNFTCGSRDGQNFCVAPGQNSTVVDVKGT